MDWAKGLFPIYVDISLRKERDFMEKTLPSLKKC
jgi:hypothetical protein